MLTTLVFAPLMLAQAATAHMVEQEYEIREVAYEELLAGDDAAAITVLEAELAQNPGDPAVLINLGAAYARIGNWERAEHYYSTARDGQREYQLELANGRWLDSRDAARLALASVELEALAAR
ncbi:MAG: tetratricopeptide repeat protein [Alteraurantiacibacter sp. bin_em_oilr2.035]|nr:tetratricopeptide repeat protein [Aurantiacibacter atlanticus]MDF1834878.1 tetratricopeptide repeat protein [Alteraurantiacibacter sp. bin_em_oilr2.035]